MDNGIASLILRLGLSSAIVSLLVTAAGAIVNIEILIRIGLACVVGGAALAGIGVLIFMWSGAQ